MPEKTNTILIVDDDKTVIEQLVTHFRRRGYEPIATANPSIVEQTLANFEVQLILLDLRMERLNGYDVLKNLRSKGIKTPVLIITAYYDDEKERLKEIGITEDDVIPKPFRDFSKIEASINRKLNRVVAPEEVCSEYEDEIYYDNRAKLLIADDEEEITDFLREMFEERKYEVATFKDGKSALEHIKSNPQGCHVALVDIAMPCLSGDHLITAIRTINPQIKCIPMSAKYPDEVEQELRNIGFDVSKLVTKPFKVPLLIETVKVAAVEAGVLGPSN
jgi:DNA-binding response OmpR family regulator